MYARAHDRAHPVTHSPIRTEHAVRNFVCVVHAGAETKLKIRMPMWVESRVQLLRKCTFYVGSACITRILHTYYTHIPRTPHAHPTHIQRPFHTHSTQIPRTLHAHYAQFHTHSTHIPHIFTHIPRNLHAHSRHIPGTLHAHTTHIHAHSHSIYVVFSTIQLLEISHLAIRLTLHVNFIWQGGVPVRVDEMVTRTPGRWFRTAWTIQGSIQFVYHDHNMCNE